MRFFLIIAVILAGAFALLRTPDTDPQEMQKQLANV